MRRISVMALAAALLAGSGLAPALAKAPKAKPPTQTNATTEQGRKLKIGPEARGPIQELDKTVKAKDEANFAARLAAAEAVAKTPDEKYIVAMLRLRHATDIHDEAARLTAIDAVLASGAAEPQELPNLYHDMAITSAGLKNAARAEQAFAKALELSPNNPDVLANYAKFRIDQKRPKDAYDLLQRAIEAKKAAGQPVPDSWYRNALGLAYESRLRSSIQLSRDLAGVSRDPKDWRNALLIYRDLGRPDSSTDLDLHRFMRLSGTLQGETEWYRLAYMLQEAGYPGESKAVLDEAVRLNALSLAKVQNRDIMNAVTRRAATARAELPALETRAKAASNGTLALQTADAFLGYGDYARAIALYRVALQKGGVDKNLVNTHLGLALALSGNKGEAETALRAVTGSRADLAAYMLLWLSQRS